MEVVDVACLGEHRLVHAGQARGSAQVVLGMAGPVEMVWQHDHAAGWAAHRGEGFGDDVRPAVAIRKVVRRGPGLHLWPQCLADRLAAVPGDPLQVHGSPSSGVERP